MVFLLPITTLQLAAVSSDATPNSAQSIAGFVTGASQRFDIPEAWIWAVMHVESNGNLTARSSKGALGLMQIMPSTWSELQAEYGLGNDPLDPHDNIIAGTAYLRQLYDRYGANGFLAAYNAGPGRYKDWLNAGRSLPPETVSYVELVRKKLSSNGAIVTPMVKAKDALWTRASLFAESPDALLPPKPQSTTTAASPFVQLGLPAPLTPPSVSLPPSDPPRFSTSDTASDQQ